MSKLDKIILFDVDGVIFDFNKPFHDWVETQGFGRANPADYNMAPSLGISDDKATRLCQEFSNNDEHFGNLPVREGVDKLLSELVSMGFKFHFITSVDEHRRATRLSALRRLVPADSIIDITCLGLCASKVNYLLTSWYAFEGYLWFDDASSNYKAGQVSGLDSYLIDQPYNQELDVGDRRIYNMHRDIIKLVKEKYSL